MSLQSGSRTVLERMARPYDPPTYADKLNLLRNHIPGLALTTDIMVGFPGETEAEHEESLAFVREMRFSGAHIFTFSPRPGTPAADMPGQVPAHVKHRRYRDMKQVTSASIDAARQAMLGRVVPVLWEERGEDHALAGLTDTYLRVHSRAEDLCPNSMTQTRIERVDADRVWGTPVPAPSGNAACGSGRFGGGQ